MFHKPLEKQDPILLSQFMKLYNLSNGNYKLHSSVSEDYYTPYERDEETGELVAGTPYLIGYTIVLSTEGTTPIGDALDAYKDNPVVNMIYSDSDDLKTITIRVRV